MAKFPFKDAGERKYFIKQYIRVIDTDILGRDSGINMRFRAWDTVIALRDLPSDHEEWRQRHAEICAIFRSEKEE